MITSLLLDLDETLLSFKADEHKALTKTLLHFGIQPTEEVVSLYVKINLSLCQAVERGELEREEVLVNRFSMLAEALGLILDARAARIFYELRLSEEHTLYDFTLPTLDRLKEKYRLYIVSNGTALVQNRRLDESGLRGYFDGIFISEEIGVNKPHPNFFKRVFEITGITPDEALIVGDSLTSDISGGLAVGIPTCHVTGGKDFRYDKIIPDYAINDVSALPSLIEKINNGKA